MKKTITFANIFLLIFFTSCTTNTNTFKEEVVSDNWKLRTCPDEWIKNNMPWIYFEWMNEQPKTSSHYYVLNEKRREIDEFDKEWVWENCKLKIRNVY